MPLVDARGGGTRRREPKTQPREAHHEPNRAEDQPSDGKLWVVALTKGHARTRTIIGGMWAAGE